MLICCSPNRAAARPNSPSQQRTVLGASLRRRTLAKARDGGARQHLHRRGAHAGHRELQVRPGDLNPGARAESHELPKLRVIPQPAQTRREREK